MTNHLKTCLLWLSSCLFALNANAQLSTNPDKFLGNITTNGNVDFGNEHFYTLWNQITPENESKWDACERQRGNFTFGGADNAFNYAKQHGFTYKFHTLVWGSQYPGWMNNLSTSEQTKAIEEWFDAVAAHYPDMPMIDVVNEAVAGHAPAPYKAALGGDGVTGYDWIIKAFQMAHERWPNAILIYNDYNTFRWQHEEFIHLVRTLRDAGAPIDAYGCQSHDLTDISFDEFKAAMDNLQNKLKMPMYSTEYDIGTTDDQQQLKQYSDQIPYMWEKDYCAGITLWGYIYGRTWTTDGNSGLIKDGEDRLAMTWLRDYMKSDAAKKAKSPFPGMKKEASVYAGWQTLKMTRGESNRLTINARLRTKTIQKVELYYNNSLLKSFTASGSTGTYTFDYTPNANGRYDFKIVVTATDGTKYERWSGFDAYNPRQSYKSQELPGTLQAEDFDSGAEGISYHDSDNKDEGIVSYRSDNEGVDIVNAKDNSGYAIGYTNSGEWLEYTVNVKEAGTYDFDAYVSSGADNSSFSLSLNEGGRLTDLTDVMPVPCVQSGSWNYYQNVHGRLLVALKAGKQIIRLNITGSSCNIDKITFNRINIDNNIKVSLSANPSPAVINENATLKATVNASSAVKDVKFYINNVLKATVSSQPYQYTYKPTVKGNYVITAIATDVNGKQSQMARLNLSVNNKRVAHKGVVNVPGTIEAENFDRGGEGFTFHDSDSQDEGGTNYRSDNEGVDIVTGNGSYALGYTASGEWTEYTVNVTQTGDYTIEAYASSGLSGSGFSVALVNGENVVPLCKISVPQTASNSWDTYKAISGKFSRPLAAGQQILRITIDNPYCNIDKIVLKYIEGTGIGNVVNTQRSTFNVYNLKGQRVDDNYKGIVIINGKKVLRK